MFLDVSFDEINREEKSNFLQISFSIVIADTVKKIKRLLINFLFL